MLKEQIGKRIKEFRIIKTGLSQEELSLKIRMDRTYLSRVESGKQNITIDKLNEICNGLGISLNDLFSGFDQKIED